MAEGGDFEDRRNKALLVMLYHRWDEFYRYRIGEAFGVGKNDVRCVLMGDLRCVRNLIVHDNAVVPRGFSCWFLEQIWVPFAAGELTITNGMIHSLMEQLNAIQVEIRAGGGGGRRRRLSGPRNIGACSTDGGAPDCGVRLLSGTPRRGRHHAPGSRILCGNQGVVRPVSGQSGPPPCRSATPGSPRDLRGHLPRDATRASLRAAAAPLTEAESTRSGQAGPAEAPRGRPFGPSAPGNDIPCQAALRRQKPCDVPRASMHHRVGVVVLTSQRITRTRCG